MITSHSGDLKHYISDFTVVILHAVDFTRLTLVISVVLYVNIIYIKHYSSDFTVVILPNMSHAGEFTQLTLVSPVVLYVNII